MLLFSNFSYNRINEGDDLLVHFMSHIDCFDHLSLRNLVSSGLDHDNFLPCGSYCKLKVRNWFLCKCRVDDKLTVDHADLCCCTWAVERDVGNTGCNGRTKHSRDFRVALRVNRHNHVYQCYVISVILREQRTHRTVDNTGSKDRMLACLTFSLIKSSRNLSHCVHLLLILNT